MMRAFRALIEGAPQAGISTPAQTSVSDSAGLILAANPKRKGVVIQNTGTTVIKLAFGATSPTQSVYHIALAACTAANDGTGGVWMDDSNIGDVRAISSAVGGTCVISEHTTGNPNWNLAADGGVNMGT